MEWPSPVEISTMFVGRFGTCRGKNSHLFVRFGIWGGSALAARKKTRGGSVLAAGKTHTCLPRLGFGVWSVECGVWSLGCEVQG